MFRGDFNKGCGQRRWNGLAGWALTGLSMILVSPRVMAQASGANPKAIRVVVEGNYAPYSFRSGDGALQGILIDQWRAWERETGLKVEIEGMDWGEALRRMRAGEFDVIDEIAETAQRRDEFDFTPGYATIEVPIFFRSDISGITDLASLKGFPVGTKFGDPHVAALSAAGVGNLILFQNHEALVAAAKEHKINVFLADAPSAFYLLNKAGIAAEFRHSAPIFRDRLQRAVRRGNRELLDQVAAGFAAIDAAELRQIEEKWHGRPITWYRPYLAYAAYAAAAAILLIAGLFAWNRTLRKKVFERTAALEESERRFRQIAENIHEVFWLTTVDLSKTLYVSPGYEAVWGRSRESLFADPRSFIAAIHAEDRPRVLEVVGRDRERGFEMEYRVVRPDGSIRWVWDRRVAIRDGEARAYRLVGNAEDITERKRAAEAVKLAEDRVRLVIDTIPTMAWSVRPDGVVDFVNQRWLDYTGISFEEEVANPTGTVHREDFARVIERWTAKMAAGEPYEDEMRLRRADGVYRWFLVRTAPLRDEQGRIVKWFGSSFDIEDRKAATEALRLSEQQLQALVGRLNTVREDEAKRIARELHDDLGQKLTALNMGLADLDLKLAEVSPDQRAQIARMHATVDQTIQVVQELSSELRLGQLDILGLTAAIDWQLKEFSRRSGIPCLVTRLDEIRNLSDAQGTAAFRILQEALTNIVRHAGATRVEVSLRAGPDEIGLWIHDNGRGIAAAALNDRKAIGLLGMRERAQSVGGTVMIIGAPDTGTTVFVTIPLCPPPGLPA